MLGYVSVGKMLGEVTSLELTEWQAYFSLKQKKTKSNRAAEEAKRRAKKYNR